MNQNAFVFPTAELVVLIEHLALNMPPLNTTALHDLQLTAADISKATDSLQENGILLYPSEEEGAGIMGEVAALLNTASNPSVLFVL